MATTVNSLGIALDPSWLKQQDMGYDKEVLDQASIIAKAKSDWEEANATGDELGMRKANQTANAAREAITGYGYGWVADALGADNGVSASNVGGYIAGISSALGNTSGYSSKGTKPSLIQSIIDGFRASGNSAYTGNSQITLSDGSTMGTTKAATSVGSPVSLAGSVTSAASSALSGVGSVLGGLSGWMPWILGLVGLFFVSRMFRVKIGH